MNGSASSRVTKIASIFGTNTSVCSWIWVSAWNSDTTTPTTRPTTISGDDTTTMVQIASRATSRVSAPVIFLSRLLQLAFVIPGWSEKDQTSDAQCAAGNLEIPGWRFARPGMTISNRHLHDVFVGLDDADAHRHHRRDRDVGLRHRRHPVHHVGLARCHRNRLRVGLLARVQDASDRVLE